MSVAEQPPALLTSTVTVDCCVIALVVYTLPTTCAAGTATPFNLNVYVAPGTLSAVITILPPSHIVSAVASESKFAVGPADVVIVIPGEVSAHESGADVVTLTVTTAPSVMSANLSTWYVVPVSFWRYPFPTVTSTPFIAHWYVSPGWEFKVLAVNIKLVTSPAQTVVPGAVVIVGLLDSSTLTLMTLEGKPSVQDTVLSVAKVNLRISVSSVIFNGVSDISRTLLVAPARLVQTLPVVALRSCHW